MKATVEHGGRQYELQISNATHHTEGEFAGNVDLVVNSKPPLGSLDSLRVRVSGKTNWLSPIGMGEVSAGIGLTFHDPALEGAPMPESVTVAWLDDGGVKVLGAVPCTRS